MAPSPAASTSAAASASSTATGKFSVGGSNLKVSRVEPARVRPAKRSSPSSHLLQIVGILLAISSGLLIGSSFVFKKKGLLRSQKGQVAGEGVAYLKSVRRPPSVLSSSLMYHTAAMVDRDDQCVLYGLQAPATNLSQ